MQTRYLTKAKLVAVNNRARKNGGNHIDPDFVEMLPERFKYLAHQTPFGIEKGWIRCWVTAGTSVSENIHTLLVDIRHDVFEKLPSLSELEGVE